MRRTACAHYDMGTCLQQGGFCDGCDRVPDHDYDALIESTPTRTEPVEDEQERRMREAVGERVWFVLDWMTKELDYDT